MACAPFAMLASHDVVTPEARSVTPHDLERQAELRACRNEFIRFPMVLALSSIGHNQFITETAETPENPARSPSFKGTHNLLNLDREEEGPSISKVSRRLAAFPT